MPYELAVLAHVGHEETVEQPGVVGLTATGRIERGAVEGDGTVAHTDNRGVELAKVRVAQVEQFRMHRAPRYASGPSAALRTARRVGSKIHD